MHLCFCLVSAPIEVTVLETSVPFVSVEPREWRSGGFMCLLGICMWEAGNGGGGRGAQALMVTVQAAKDLRP